MCNKNNTYNYINRLSNGKYLINYFLTSELYISRQSSRLLGFFNVFDRSILAGPSRSSTFSSTVTSFVSSSSSSTSSSSSSSSSLNLKRDLTALSLLSSKKMYFMASANININITIGWNNAQIISIHIKKHSKRTQQHFFAN
ncbi:hypothetical protein PUN28_005597 [Cardiocondyla obscurior]|uniref:Uncharacterized protein n=1 Tax=Cardiocondyla obscurior TaxID=286306 RepID=A0AAW2GHB7_9HYME